MPSAVNIRMAFIAKEPDCNQGLNIISAFCLCHCCLQHPFRVLWNVYRATGSMILVFNRRNPRWLYTGLLTECNTMKRHLWLMGLTESPLRRRCGAQKETSAHVLRTYEALVTLSHHCLGSYSFDPEDVRNPALESSWVFIKGQNSHDFDFSSKGHKVPVEKSKFVGT